MEPTLEIRHSTSDYIFTGNYAEGKTIKIKLCINHDLGRYSVEPMHSSGQGFKFINSDYFEKQLAICAAIQEAILFANHILSSEECDCCEDE